MLAGRASVHDDHMGNPVPVKNWFRALVLFSVPASLLAARPVRRQQEKEVRLLFTGDIMLTRQVDVELRRTIQTPWSGFENLFGGAAWVGGNFEGAIGPSSNCVPTRSPCFATPERAAELLRRAGFRLVTVENNHAGDLGSLGREHTATTFKQAGLEVVDFNNSPQFIPLGTGAVAFVALTLIPAADGRVQHIPSAQVSDKLRFAKQRADLVVVSIHWGNELMEWPSQSQRKQAAWLVDQGADLIVGHHPHVIQQPQCVSGRPVFFSLGNHVFDQENPKTKEGMIADCHIRGGRLVCQSLRTRTDPGTTIPRVVRSDRMVDSALFHCRPESKQKPR